MILEWSQDVQDVQGCAGNRMRLFLESWDVQDVQVEIENTGAERAWTVYSRIDLSLGSICAFRSQTHPLQCWDDLGEFSDFWVTLKLRTKIRKIIDFRDIRSGWMISHEILTSMVVFEVPYKFLWWRLSFWKVSGTIFENSRNSQFPENRAFVS